MRNMASVCARLQLSVLRGDAVPVSYDFLFEKIIAQRHAFFVVGIFTSIEHCNSKDLAINFTSVNASFVEKNLHA